jgi:16S rRNA G966 N2-methylase RsmD
VDKSRVACEFIERNLTSLGFRDRARVMCADWRVALHGRFGAEGAGDARFDLVFVDPPYESGVHGNVLTELDLQGSVLHSGLVVCEYSAHVRPGETLGRLRRFREERYGETLVGFYMYMPEG